MTLLSNVKTKEKNAPYFCGFLRISELYSMVVKAKTMIQRSGSKREGDDLYIWPCRGLRVSAAFFTILGLLPGLHLAKKRRFLSLVSHGRDSIRLSRYVSQSDYVVLLATAAALRRWRRPSLVMYECGTL